MVKIRHSFRRYPQNRPRHNPYRQFFGNYNCSLKNCCLPVLRKAASRHSLLPARSSAFLPIPAYCPSHCLLLPGICSRHIASELSGSPRPHRPGRAGIPPDNASLPYTRMAEVPQTDRFHLHPLSVSDETPLPEPHSMLRPYNMPAAAPVSGPRFFFRLRPGCRHDRHLSRPYLKVMHFHSVLNRRPIRFSQRPGMRHRQRLRPPLH